MTNSNCPPLKIELSTSDSDFQAPENLTPVEFEANEGSFGASPLEIKPTNSSAVTTYDFYIRLEFRGSFHLWL